MSKTAIMTDTNSGITPEAAAEKGLYLLKMPFLIDGEDHLEYGDISYEEFFRRLDSGASLDVVREWLKEMKIIAP